MQLFFDLRGILVFCSHTARVKISSQSVDYITLRADFTFQSRNKIGLHYISEKKLV